MSDSTIWPIDRTLSGASTQDQSGPRSNGNEEVLYIPQNSQNGAFPSDGIMSYPEHSLGDLTPIQRCSQSISTVPPPFWIRENLEVMAIKEYSTLPQILKLKPHHQMQFSVLPRTLLFYAWGRWESYFSTAVATVSIFLALSTVLSPL